jgi:gluconate 2-dehydrogenase gamma chain
MTDRRSFLRGASMVLGHAALGNVLTGFAASPTRPTFFNDAELETVRLLVDLILPETDSPSASAAGTHYFIDLALPACANPTAQRTFRDGLKSFAGMVSWSPQRRVAALTERANADQALEYDASFFKILKDYTLSGYFLSETGATRALAYERVPGGFQGDVPLAPDQKAWAI